MNAPDWDDLRAFLAVARTGRLARAGKALDVRHTTIARRVAALEASLGAALFHRTAEGWRLTRAGERVLVHAQAAEADVLRAVAHARDEGDTVSGRVRVAMPDSWAAEWLAPRLADLHARHPALQVELLTGNAPLSLTRGEADVAVRTPRPTQPDLVATRLPGATMGLYGTPALVAAWPEPRAGVPLAVYVPAFDFLQKAAWFRAVVAGADVRLRSSSTAALAVAAETGFALAVLPSFMARRRGLVRAAPRPVARPEVWVATHVELRHEPRVAATIAFLRELRGDLGDAGAP